MIESINTDVTRNPQDNRVTPTEVTCKQGCAKGAVVEPQILFDRKQILHVSEFLLDDITY
jgi:hypothetical protein